MPNNWLLAIAAEDNPAAAPLLPRSSYLLLRRTVEWLADWSYRWQTLRFRWRIARSEVGLLVHWTMKKCQRSTAKEGHNLNQDKAIGVALREVLQIVVISVQLKDGGFPLHIRRGH